MKERIISCGDLEKYMGEQGYSKFVRELQKKMKVRSGVPIWIVAQVIEEKDILGGKGK